MFRSVSYSTNHWSVAKNRRSRNDCSIIYSNKQSTTSPMLLFFCERPSRNCHVGRSRIMLHTFSSFGSHTASTKSTHNTSIEVPHSLWSHKKILPSSFYAKQTRKIITSLSSPLHTYAHTQWTLHYPQHWGFLAMPSHPPPLLLLPPPSSLCWVQQHPVDAEDDLHYAVQLHASVPMVWLRRPRRRIHRHRHQRKNETQPMKPHPPPPPPPCNNNRCGCCPSVRGCFVVWMPWRGHRRNTVTMMTPPQRCRLRQQRQSMRTIVRATMNPSNMVHPVIGSSFANH